MKINKYIIFGFLHLLCTNQILAQWDTDTQNRIFVSINPEGCPIYEQPEREVINTIPFGGLLDKTYILEVKLDTVYCDAWTARGILKEKKYPLPTLCVGYWLKIKYEGRVGWIWDGFMRNMDNIADGGLGMVKQFYCPEFRSDFILLKAGEFHKSDFKYNPEWHWYGISQVGCNSILQEISGLSHFISIDGDKMKYRYITTAYSNYELDYIIGSKDSLRTGILLGDFPELSDAIEQSAYMDAARLWIDPIPKRFNNSEIFEIYAVGENGKKQKLEAGISEGFYGETQFGFERLDWFGNLDNDNQLDYIIRFVSPSGDLVIRLFLSSAAKEGEIVSPVSELIYFDVP